MARSGCCEWACTLQSVQMNWLLKRCSIGVTVATLQVYVKAEIAAVETVQIVRKAAIVWV